MRGFLEARKDRLRSPGEPCPGPEDLGARPGAGGPVPQAEWRQEPVCRAPVSGPRGPVLDCGGHGHSQAGHEDADVLDTDP